MEIVESAPAAKVGIQLDFIATIAGRNATGFRLRPQGDMTSIVGSMYGPAPFVSKLLQVFVSMDAMIGKDFDEGLANLKALTGK